MIVHLIDGTYELFRHFYGILRFKKTDPPFGAVTVVLRMITQMIDDGATHVGVATDHIIESFRNGLWPGYKTGAGRSPASSRGRMAEKVTSAPKERRAIKPNDSAQVFGDIPPPR